MTTQIMIFAARIILTIILLTAVFLESGPFTAGALFAMIFLVEHLLIRINKITMGVATSVHARTIKCDSYPIGGEEDIRQCDKCECRWKYIKGEPPPCVQKAMDEVEKNR